VCRKCGEEAVLYTGERMEGDENIINKRNTTREEAAKIVIEDTGQENLTGAWQKKEVEYWSFSPFRGDDKAFYHIRKEVE
jgi:hypothetical protein